MSERNNHTGRKIAVGTVLGIIGLIPAADAIFDHAPKERQYSREARDAQIAGHTEVAKQASGDSGDEITWLVGEGIAAISLFVSAGITIKHARESAHQAESIQVS